MTVSGTEVRVGMTASVSPSSVNTSGGLTIGTPNTAVVFTDTPAVAYSLRMDISDGETLTLDLADGAVTGGVAAVAAIPTMDVTGTLSPDVTGTYYQTGTLNGKPYYTTDQVAWNGSDIRANSVIYWTGSSWAILEQIPTTGNFNSSATVATPDLVPSWTVIGDATGTAVVNDGTPIPAVPATAAYRISGTAWDQTDFEGQPLPAMTKVHSTLISSSSTGATVSIGVDALDPIPCPCPMKQLQTNPTGVHPFAGNTVSFTADGGNLSLTIDIHAG